MRRVTTYIDADLYEAFKKALDGVPVAAGLRRIVEDFIKKREAEGKK